MASGSHQDYNLLPWAAGVHSGRLRSRRFLLSLNFASTVMQRFLTLFLLALGSWAFEKGSAEEDVVRIWPENPVVEFGGSLVLNCSAKCGNIGLETAFTRFSIGNGSSWRAFYLTNIRDPSNPLCYANCKDHKTKAARVTITIYKPPESVELDPVPEMEVGKPYNLTCQVFSVAPIQNLTITLLKGAEQLLVKTFENHTGPEDHAVVVSHPIIAQPNDHNKTVICQTFLDLRPRGPLLKNTSHSIPLRSFDFADAPQLHTDLFLEAGTKMKVTCDASQVSPAEEAMFELWFAGQPLTFITSVMGDVASARTVVTSSSVGEHELNCKVSLGPVTKNVMKTVNVFALPKPILQIDNSEAVVNQTVNITCSAGGNASPGFKMQIRDAAEILTSSNQDHHFLQHAVVTQEEDNGREFICQVTLIVDGHTKERTMSQKLTVFYGPQIDDSNCPHTLTWKEGSLTSFTCSALGNPKPRVQCWRDGRSYNIGEQQLVQREHDGIYHCNATNQYGSDVRDVTIHVESSQSIGLIIGCIIAALIVISCVIAIVYFVYYNNQKIGTYYLWKRGMRRQSPQAVGSSAEQTFLNGQANV